MRVLREAAMDTAKSQAVEIERTDRPFSPKHVAHPIDPGQRVFVEEEDAAGVRGIDRCLEGMKGISRDK